MKRKGKEIRTVDVIKVPLENIPRLMQETGAGKTTIYNALAYRSNTEQASKIRRLAVRDYNGVITKRTIFLERL